MIIFICAAFINMQLNVGYDWKRKYVEP